jgi:hypothetical protein
MAARVARLTVQSNYSDLSDQWAPHIAGALGNVFGSERNLGALIAFSNDQRDLSADALWTDPWRLSTDPVTGNEFYLPRSLSVQRYDLTRKRRGATANIEYRPNEQATYFVRGNYSDFVDDAVRHRSDIELDEDGLVFLTDTTALVDVGDVSERGNTEIVQDVRIRKEQLTIWGMSVGGENQFGKFSVDYQAGHSYAKEDNKRRLAVEYVFFRPHAGRLLRRQGAQSANSVHRPGRRRGGWRQLRIQRS